MNLECKSLKNICIYEYEPGIDPIISDEVVDILYYCMILEISVVNVFLNLHMCLFQELEASDELDTICPKAPKLEER